MKYLLTYNEKFRWTEEACKEEEAKYISRSEFKKNSSGAFNAAYRNGWLKELIQNQIFCLQFKSCKATGTSGATQSCNY